MLKWYQLAPPEVQWERALLHSRGHSQVCSPTTLGGFGPTAHSCFQLLLGFLPQPLLQGGQDLGGPESPRTQENKC